MISNASSWAKFTFIIIEKENLNILIDSYETADVVDISSIDAIHPREDFLPVAIPEDIYLNDLFVYMEKYETIKFKTPIVG
ncbi:unnamed protein product [Rotaria sordida]|uniref:Uncharacterized protein n=1 Tax=Rotaria sordida TaxID=392033 RepID=A0A819AMR3_9BILA|nr:unnamed protein product [Rotaria sordida]CAF3788119.1 unnamed protein product [Rotaria sordida]